LRKDYFFYALALVLSISVILIADFLLSKTFVQNKHCYKYSEYFYELKKNCEGKFRFKKSFPLISIYTDEMGLRVGKNKIKKNLNKENIFIFGDSFTYGVGLEYEKTFVGLIEKKLDKYNHFNFGVGSYSPSVYVHKLNEALNSGKKPSKIIVFLDLSDVINESARWRFDENTKIAQLQTNDLYNLVKEKKDDFSESNFKILENIFSLINYNLRLLRSKITNITSKNDKIKTSIQGSFTYTSQDNLDKKFWKKNTFETGIANIEKRFDDLKEMSNNHKFHIHLVVYPWAETLEFGQKKFNWSEFSKKLCNHDRCHLIDAISEFSKYKLNNKNWATDLYFLNDEHFNEKGAKLLSEIVISKIK
tara:strand:- start:548 stop:1633 length:1086 start_codon:yes stop_codon:yes gene_type:complete